MTAPTPRQQYIIDIIAKNKLVSISEIRSVLPQTPSLATLNRDLAILVKNQIITRIGKGRATSYTLSDTFHLLSPAPLNYFDIDLDKRQARQHFNHSLLDLIESADLLTKSEKEFCENMRQQYQKNLAEFSSALYEKELERLTIDISWKSSQIEGNTYSLLETERLFREHKEAAGKTRAEATMLLNHKTALSFLHNHLPSARLINVAFIESCHKHLVENLGVTHHIRSRIVGITGTIYKPLDNSYHIREALDHMCAIIQKKEDPFEKALIAVALISYIQPFEDGNKRTGRMISNALLMAHNACPLSYRSIDSLDYKKAMLLFYEQNNLSLFKEIFIEQVRFSAENYFR